MTPNKSDFLTNRGKTNNKNRILTICSKILEIVLGVTFILPKKYPFNIEVILINGKVNAIASNK